MFVIGLVGGVASGKSLVAQLLADRGAVVLSADRAAHEVLELPEVRDTLVARWGRGVLNAQGEIYLRGQPVEPEELERILVAAVAENPANQSVVIRADQTTTFQPVVTVMDLCNRAGVSDYSVTTREGPAP